MQAENYAPPFDNVRVATSSDVPRIASVAAAGFFWSPTFQFQRPFHEQFPEDTVSSYWHEYQTLIADPASVVLVAEDASDPNESEKVHDALLNSPLHRPRMITETRVVVGVCSIVLKPGSRLIGCFEASKGQREHMGSSPVHPSLSRLNRDQCVEALQLYGRATAPAKKRYLAGEMRLGTLVVHPFYWSRGHATRLVSWCTSLADMDGAALGISATPMGATVAARAGFEQRDIICFKCLGASARSRAVEVALWIGVRPPSSSSSGASTRASDAHIYEVHAL